MSLSASAQVFRCLLQNRIVDRDRGYYDTGKKQVIKHIAEVVRFYCSIYVCLTALVRAPLWRGGKKNASTGRRVAYRLKKQKRSRCFESTIRIKDFKYGSLLNIFVQKNNEAQRSQVSQF